MNLNLFGLFKGVGTQIKPFEQCDRWEKLLYIGKLANVTIENSGLYKITFRDGVFFYAENAEQYTWKEGIVNRIIVTVYINKDIGPSIEDVIFEQ